MRPQDARVKSLFRSLLVVPPPRRAQADLEQERSGRLEAEDVVSRLKAQLQGVRDAEQASRRAAEQTLAQLDEEFEGGLQQAQVRRRAAL